MNIGILGGTFDPVHKGHIQAARNALEYGAFLDEVWLVPAIQNPLKERKPTSFDDRYSMCELAVRNEPHISASDAELYIAERLNKDSLYTDELLDNLPKENNYYMIIGTDNLNCFYKWHNYRHILDEYGLIVLKRPGYVVDEYDDKIVEIINHPNVHVIKSVSTIEMSSTAIRKSLSAVPEKVLKYIVDNNLYDDKPEQKEPERKEMVTSEYGFYDYCRETQLRKDSFRKNPSEDWFIISITGKMAQAMCLPLNDDDISAIVTYIEKITDKELSEKTRAEFKDLLMNLKPGKLDNCIEYDPEMSMFDLFSFTKERMIIRFGIYNESDIFSKDNNDLEMFREMKSDFLNNINCDDYTAWHYVSGLVESCFV